MVRSVSTPPTSSTFNFFSHLSLSTHKWRTELLIINHFPLTLFQLLIYFFSHFFCFFSKKKKEKNVFPQFNQKKKIENELTLSFRVIYSIDK